MTRASRIRLAIVHYHLRRGGVTRVIEHTLAALPHDRVEITLLTGEPPPTSSQLASHARVVQGLGYAGPDTPGDATRLADNLEREARSALGALPDIWHIHNHALGKNPALPGAVFELARRGARLLLHIHDFAEDGRPAMYRKLRGDREENPTLYPLAEHVHYTVLNDRDLAFLGGAFGPDAPVYFLPNAVSMARTEATGPDTRLPRPSRRSAKTGHPQPAGHAEASARRRRETSRYLYPTRAIRRKNLGELLLWSALAPPGDRFATTLAPENPEARSVYRAWVDFATAQNLPVDFEVGVDRSFHDVVQTADVLITTSVAEGFGLAFLEPWLTGRPLLGRDLPEVTPALRREGVNLDALYEQVRVPVTWVGRARLQERVASALGEIYIAYAAPAPAHAVERAMSHLLSDDRVDFGRLDEAMQRDVIQRVTEDREARIEIDPPGPMDPHLSPDVVDANRKVVEQRFGLTGYGQRLLERYETLLNAPCSGTVEGLPPNDLVARFLAPERINLLRT